MRLGAGRGLNLSIQNICFKKKKREGFRGFPVYVFICQIGFKNDDLEKEHHTEAAANEVNENANKLLIKSGTNSNFFSFANWNSQGLPQRVGEIKLSSLQWFIPSVFSVCCCMATCTPPVCTQHEHSSRKHRTSAVWKGWKGHFLFICSFWALCFTLAHTACDLFFQIKCEEHLFFVNFTPDLWIIQKHKGS